MLPWYFAAFSDILIETFVPNLVSLTGPSLQIKGRTQTRYFRFADFRSVFRKQTLPWNFNMTLIWQVNHDKIKKNLEMEPCQQVVASLSFFRFMANLQLLGGQTPDGWSIKFKFSLIATFYLAKPENRTKESPTQL